MGHLYHGYVSHNQREGFNESNPVGQITGRNIWISPLIQPFLTMICGELGH